MISSNRRAWTGARRTWLPCKAEVGQSHSPPPASLTPPQAAGTANQRKHHASHGQVAQPRPTQNVQYATPWEDWRESSISFNSMHHFTDHHGTNHHQPAHHNPSGCHGTPCGSEPHHGVAVVNAMPWLSMAIHAAASGAINSPGAEFVGPRPVSLHGGLCICFVSERHTLPSRAMTLCEVPKSAQASA